MNKIILTAAFLTFGAAAAQAELFRTHAGGQALTAGEIINGTPGSGRFVNDNVPSSWLNQEGRLDAGICEKFPNGMTRDLEISGHGFYIRQMGRMISYTFWIYPDSHRTEWRYFNTVTFLPDSSRVFSESGFRMGVCWNERCDLGRTLLDEEVQAKNLSEYRPSPGAQATNLPRLLLAVSALDSCCGDAQCRAGALGGARP